MESAPVDKKLGGTTMSTKARLRDNLSMADAFTSFMPSLCRWRRARKFTVLIVQIRFQSKVAERLFYSPGRPCLSLAAVAGQAIIKVLVSSPALPFKLNAKA
jgi:hypothetical protein|tara:strand:- start:3167 stop:3472 length:306 start_codon:yes stop_codon:yes gene_type:complete